MSSIQQFQLRDVLDSRTRERYLLALLDDLLSWFFAPFIRARSLSALAKTSYWYGLVLLVGLCGLLWLLNYLNLHLTRYLSFAPTQFPAGLKGFIRQVIAYVPLDHLIMAVGQYVKVLPLYFFLPIAYLLVGFIPGARLRIGRYVSKVLLDGITLATELGDWCIRRRWKSILLILALTFVVSLSGYYVISHYIAESYVNEQVNEWLPRYEDFVYHNSFGDADLGTYHTIKAYWRPEFDNNFSSTRDNKPHPIAVLNRVLEIFYAEADALKGKPPSSWGDYAKTQTKKLETIIGEEPIIAEPENEPSKRARCMIEAFLGKLDLRFTEDNAYLVKARKHFGYILNITDGNRESWALEARSAAWNGIGAINSTTFNKLVKSGTSLPEYAGTCQTPRDCVIEAEKYYRAAGADFDGCSVESTRKTNNLLDLYMRVGLNYDVYSATYSSAPNANELSKAEIAHRLDDEIQELIRCAKPNRLLPTVFVTISQGAATSAILKSGACEDAVQDVKNAALYLKLAYNIGDASNLSDWDLAAFRALTALRSSQCGGNGTPARDYSGLFLDELDQSSSYLESPKKQLMRLLK